MIDTFSEMLAEDGKKNSLGRANEVAELVSNDKSRLDELYQTMFDDNAWVRMRAADAYEKVCRQHPIWLVPYIDRLQQELAHSTQASIQWHLAEIYVQVELNHSQKKRAIEWAAKLLSTADADWIVAANCMNMLAHFTRQGDVTQNELLVLLRVQQSHRSNAVVKRANKLFSEFSQNY
jgi:hypothetical protein